MKKLISVLLTVSMFLCFVACDNETKKKDGNKKNKYNVAEDNGDFGGENNNFADEEGFNGNTEENIKSFDFSDSDFSNAQIGDNITYGSYEQDNNTENGKEPIEWLVLDKQNGKILVISKQALDRQPYHSVYYEDTTWEKCTLRTWLNDDFINNAFTNHEQARIPSVKVTVALDTYSSTDFGNDTMDKIFLLSQDEANKYFALDEDKQCTSTAYTMSQGAIHEAEYGNNCYWWLRSQHTNGDNQSALAVTYSGKLNNGSKVYSVGVAVRPVMWIEL